MLFTDSKYVLRSSGISRKSGALIVRYSQNKEWISFVFYCLENPSIAQNFGTTGLIQVVFLSKMCLSKWAMHSCMQSNRKLKMFDFRPISLDRITYYYFTVPYFLWHQCLFVSLLVVRFWWLIKKTNHNKQTSNILHNSDRPQIIQYIVWWRWWYRKVNCVSYLDTGLHMYLPFKSRCNIPLRFWLQPSAQNGICSMEMIKEADYVPS